MSETPPPPPEQAAFRPSKWPGLIWAVPLAAVGIIGWLSLSAFVHHGPRVRVAFPVTGGLRAGTTKVEYQGYVVGHVSAVRLGKDLQKLQVTLDFDNRMAGHLGPGTRYWLAGTRFSLAHLSNIKDMISGPVVMLDPHAGATVTHAQGLGAPPALSGSPPGLPLTLTAARLDNLSAGSPVFFKGYHVGQVTSVAMAPDGGHFNIALFIKAPWEGLVTARTRFWNAGAVRLSTGGGGPGVQLQSVPALLMGAVAFETPPVPGAAPAKSGATFTLYASKTQAQDAPGPDAVRYAAIFPGGPHGLKPGAPVQIEGAPAGSVSDVALQYDAGQGALRTRVTFSLSPERAGVADAAGLNAMLATLVGKGLRAEMGSSVPVVGGKIIQLEMAKDAPPAAIQPGTPPLIPSFGAGGGDVSGVITQLNQVLASVNGMRLDQIAANVQSATRHLASLTGSAQTRRTLRHLDQTMRHIDDITRRADAQLPALLSAVQQSADQAQHALRDARNLLAAQRQGNAAADSGDLPQTLYQLSEAARSLRALSDFLTSHPGALLTGRRD